MGIESQATDERSRVPSPGQIGAAPLSRMRTLLVLGRGGMGRVELAEEEGPKRDMVAVKRLLPELVTSREKRELFAREAAIACRLAHPNLVRTRRYGEHDGEPFLVMDYVDGVTLDRLLELASAAGKRFPRALAALVLAEVARGLHAAHEMLDENGEPLRLVHRDVSPHNVMLGRAGDVLLLDFGVAKIEAERGLTRTGEVRGKTAYMSPEQGLGDPLDRRSDLFALGALLHECVQGTRMWGEGTDLDVLRKLALERPPELPGDDALSKLYGRLVEKDRELRPSTADEVADEALAFAVASSRKSEHELRADLATFVLGLAGDELDLRRREIDSARTSASLVPPASPAEASPVPAAADERDESSLATSSRAVAAADVSPARRSPSRSWLVGIVALGVVGTLAFAAARTTERSSPDARPSLGASPSAATASTTSALPSPAGSNASEVAPDPKTTVSSASPTHAAPNGSTASPSVKPTAHAPTGSASVGPRVPPSASAPRVSPSTSPSHGPLNVDPTPF